MGVARSPMRRWIAAALALAALGAAATAAPARIAFDSKVTIRFVERDTVESLRGRVTSSLPACEPRRRVVIYGDDPATKEVEWSVRGDDKTDVNGRWFVTAEDGGPIPDGSYYAKVKRRDIAKGRCRPDRSKTIRVGRA